MKACKRSLLLEFMLLAVVGLDLYPGEVGDSDLGLKEGAEGDSDPEFSFRLIVVLALDPSVLSMVVSPPAES
jgi:hypothetical protein